MALDANLTAQITAVLTASDPAATLRDQVQSAGGYWINPNSTYLFEISFAGITGIGFGAEDAAQNWIGRAHSYLSLDELDMPA